ncbi:HlyD family type I secretion periplasmic adaptor subunit [Pseudomonas sp. OF001]|uniref:HlyD family type I secretion periplasmic adaptor subunit n=1 Tax=Pseudomonas sp. OF001 TaxID=2772300 RepID=UPI001F35A02A|nr:HlyD family type I secretion periplasmic adaptor subunit [Pseudomonas sp. OF001]
MSTLDFGQGSPCPAPTIAVDDRKTVRRGLALVLVAFGGFLLWAWLAPLDAGVVASATVKVSSNRKSIEHLTGGSVEAILVREGDSVSEGQPLVRLDATEARAEQGVIGAQYLAARTMENRLEAERDDREQVAFDAGLSERFGDSAELAAALDLQRRLFATRRTSRAGEVSILQESLDSAENQAKGLQQIYAARAAQLRFLQQELDGARQLAAEGYIPRNRMLELERSAAELNAAQAENQNELARIRGQAAELRLRIRQHDHDYRKEIQAQLADVRKERSALADRLQALDYQVRHTVIRAPIDGMVQGLNIATIGGVIQSGARIMEIVPANEPLQIDAMLPVQVIDRMEPGLPVSIAFPAFNHAQTPSIPGRVLTVSADRLIDEESRQPFYLAQIEVTTEGMAMLGANRIRAGMPASVTIRTGERNLLSYLLKPLLDRVASSFKEQ